MALVQSVVNGLKLFTSCYLFWMSYIDCSGLVCISVDIVVQMQLLYVPRFLR